MKSEQIKLALAIDTTRSISKAAEQLYISQPTASNMLRALEDDLGYQIFVRGRNGIELTDRGYKFIEYANTLNAGFEAVYRLKDVVEHQSLTVLSFQYHFSESAFAQVTKDELNKVGGFVSQFRVISSTADAFRMIRDGLGDIAVALCRKRDYEKHENFAQRNGMVVEKIAEMGLELSCAADNPIIKNGCFEPSQLSDRPCFVSLFTNDVSSFVPDSLRKYIGSVDKMISIGPGQTRYELMTKTGGYLVSTPVDPADKEKYNLESVTIEGYELCLFTICIHGSENKEIIRKYISELTRKVKVV